MLFLVSSIILGCAGIGGGGVIVVNTFKPYLSTRNWVSTDAFLAHIRLHEMRRGRRRVSVRCEAVYSYVVDNIRYKGTNTSVYESDPFGGFQRHLCEKLQENHRTGNDRCWYDIENPSRSAMEKVFVPELMIFALLALSIAGSAGLIGATIAIVRLRRASLISTSALGCDEQNWPAIWLVALVYWLMLAVVAVPISIDTLLQGVVLSVVNLLFGVIHICGVALCIWRIRKSRYAGILLVPNEVMFRDTFTLRIPSTWRGEPRLVMTWFKENDFLMYSEACKPVILYPIEIRENAAVNCCEVEFVPSPIPESVPLGHMCVLRISGDIGESEYQGTFLFGSAAEFRDMESRRHLGPSRMYSI